jgi:hypothetical protein
MEMPNNFAKEKPRLWFIIDTLLNLSLAKTVPANSTEDYSLLTGMASVQGKKKGSTSTSILPRPIHSGRVCAPVSSRSG